MKKKNKVIVWSIGVILGVGLLSEILPEPPGKEEEVVKVPETSTVSNEEEKAEKKEPPKEKIEVDVTPKTEPLAKEEVMSLITLDNEMEQFENGLFVLKDKTLIQADIYFFNGGNGYIDGTAVFSDGKLARIRLTLSDDSEIEEAFEQFGIYDVENIERPIKSAFAYEYTFNHLFHRNNIHLYPYEID